MASQGEICICATISVGIVFLRESIPLTTVLGTLLITGAAVYSFVHKRRNSEN